MKVSEIVDEIKYGHFPISPSIDSSTIINAQLLGKYSIHEIHATKFDNFIMFCVLNGDNTYQGYILCIDKDDGVIFKESYVHPEYRRQGILSHIILYILRISKQKIYILSDEIMTDDSRQMIYKLAERNIIQIKNLSTNQQFSNDELSRLFADTNDNEVGLIIESKNTNNILERHELFNPITGYAEISEAKFGNIVRNKKYYD